LLDRKNDLLTEDWCREQYAVLYEQQATECTDTEGILQSINTEEPASIRLMPTDPACPPLAPELVTQEMIQANPGRFVPLPKGMNKSDVLDGAREWAQKQLAREQHGREAAAKKRTAQQEADKQKLLDMRQEAIELKKQTDQNVKNMSEEEYQRFQTVQESLEMYRDQARISEISPVTPTSKIWNDEDDLTVPTNQDSPVLLQPAQFQNEIESSSMIVGREAKEADSWSRENFKQMLHQERQKRGFYILENDEEEEAQAERMTLRELTVEVSQLENELHGKNIDEDNILSFENLMLDIEEREQNNANRREEIFKNVLRAMGGEPDGEVVRSQNLAAMPTKVQSAWSQHQQLITTQKLEREKSQQKRRKNLLQRRRQLLWEKKEKEREERYRLQRESESLPELSEEDIFGANKNCYEDEELTPEEAMKVKMFMDAVAHSGGDPSLFGADPLKL